METLFSVVSLVVAIGVFVPVVLLAVVGLPLLLFDLVWRITHQRAG